VAVVEVAGIVEVTAGDEEAGTSIEVRRDAILDRRRKSPSLEHRNPR
jgi:hypothetical protein